jgi:hypothetical protein
MSIQVGAWESGLYFIQLRAQDGRVGFAPFTVRPRARAKLASLAVILPTNTWQAYNLRDMDGDGDGDTWYADSSVHTVDLTRPYVPPGMPAGLAHRLQFVRWLYRHGKKVDFYADDDFERFSSARWLAAHYRMLVFAGHEEYVTPTEYDLTAGYRDRGGNIAFLSANSFYFRVTRSGQTMQGRTKWRDLGRPEAALVGLRYVGWSHGISRRKPYAVKGARTAHWLFVGTGLSNGDRFGRFGVEVDARGADSPRRIILLAQAKDIFGPGRSAEMAYYSTPGGARVFAAGALNFGTEARTPIVDKLLVNIFGRLEQN